MNKFMKKAATASVLVVALALVVVVTGAFAQGPSMPDLPDGTGQMHQGNNVDGTGLGVRAVDEADMHAAIAEALGMSLENFEAALAEGQTPYTLALELGVDFAVIQAAMSELHTAALEQATAEGLIPQERANWMQGRQAGHGTGVDGTVPGTGNMAQGAVDETQGSGNMAGGAGNMARSSANQGGYGGDCLYETP
jgi:hypothetical protein